MNTDAGEIIINEDYGDRGSYPPFPKKGELPILKCFIKLYKQTEDKKGS